DQRRPDRHRQARGGTYASGHDVAGGPRQCAGEAEQDREEWRVGGTAERDDGETDQADEDAELLSSGRALVEGQRGDDDGEDDLNLNNERREARRHAQVQRQVEKAELAE